MRQLIEKILCVAVLCAGLPAARAYSLAGNVATAPDSTFETVENGYNVDVYLARGGLGTGPRNIGEEYRLNAPVLYYTYDASYLDYFGTNGTAAGDQAFAILNNTFTYTNGIATNGIGVDGFSDSISELPDYSLHINTTAFGLGLEDLKSTLLTAMMPQLGLEDPDRYVWTLRNVNPTGAGIVTGGHCPEDAYFEVIQRNFGLFPANVIPTGSSYINDELYSYYIFYWPNCTPVGGGAPYHYVTVNYPVSSPLGNGFPLADTAVASAGVGPGYFYTSLTRDDLAGLRYMLTTNNVNYENPAPGALLVATNLAPTIVLTSSNLYTLLQTAQVTDPALLPGLFPGLIVDLANSTSYYTPGFVTNIVSTVTYPYGVAYGYFTLVPTPVVTPAFLQVYVTAFANIITNGNLINNPNIVLANHIMLNYATNTVVQTVETTLGPSGGFGQPYPPTTVAVTNTAILSTATVNVPSGEYLILPPGACGFKILAEITNQVVYTTNIISSGTNASGFVGTISQVTAFTPHQFLVQPINCTDTAPAPGLYQGIGKVKFVRADFDSEFGQTFRPVTNNYTMVLVTNSQFVTQTFQRVVTAPDILIRAADITPNYPFFNAVGENTPNFVPDPGAQYAGLSGPGTITPPATFTFNKVGDLFLNGSLAALGLDTNAFYLGQTRQVPWPQGEVWASFDATTNPPFIYGSSLQNLGNQAVIQVSPAPPFLADGTNGDVYPVTPFTATGGAFTQPYTWSATGLPAGLGFTSNSDSTATLAPNQPGQNIPTQPGTFDFTIQLTDYVGRSVTWNYTITIH